MHLRIHISVAFVLCSGLVAQASGGSLQAVPAGVMFESSATIYSTVPGAPDDPGVIVAMPSSTGVVASFTKAAILAGLNADLGGSPTSFSIDALSSWNDVAPMFYNENQSRFEMIGPATANATWGIFMASIKNPSSQSLLEVGSVFDQQFPVLGHVGAEVSGFYLDNSILPAIAQATSHLEVSASFMNGIPVASGQVPQIKAHDWAIPLAYLASRGGIVNPTEELPHFDRVAFSVTPSSALIGRTLIDRHYGTRLVHATSVILADWGLSGATYRWHNFRIYADMTEFNLRNSDDVDGIAVGSIAATLQADSNLAMFGPDPDYILFSTAIVSRANPAVPDESESRDQLLAWSRICTDAIC